MAGDKVFTANLPDVGEQRNPAQIKLAFNELLGWVNEIFSGSGDDANAGKAIGVDGDGNIVYLDVDLDTVSWTVKTTDFTVVPNNKYLLKTSADDITLPNSPAEGDQFLIAPAHGFDMTTVDILQAASGERINGVAATYRLRQADCIYYGVCRNTGTSNTGWSLFAIPLATNLVDPSTNGGRISLESGVSLSSGDITAATTIYFNQHKHNRIALLTQASPKEWAIFTINNQSVAVPNTTNTPFSVFASGSGSTITMSTVNWTSASDVGAAALTRVDGVLCLASDTTKRFLGSGCTTGVSGQCENSKKLRTLVNQDNQEDLDFYCTDSSSSYNYTSATVRARNGNTTYGEGRVGFMVGYFGPLVEASNLCEVRSEATATSVLSPSLIGMDSTTAAHADSSTDTDSVPATYDAGITKEYSTSQSIIRTRPSAGFHYLQRLESGASNILFINGIGGLRGSIRG